MTKHQIATVLHELIQEWKAHPHVTTIMVDGFATVEEIASRFDVGTTLNELEEFVEAGQ